ncbi:MAG: SBBP repeat-containing protein [Candidatus Zixiibacteriota bacterium]|nr:MAG: SBBP repeat-containing protein [candidate division Zixibacteria bacterium]
MAKKLIFFVVMAVLAAPAFAHVDTAWVRYYDGTGGDEDIAKDIAVDDSNYVYVTGWSTGSGGAEEDYLTIKYDEDGATVWTERYDGPLGDEDCARVIAVDDSFYVYVSGRSYRLFENTDFTTIKYYPGGGTVWLRRYNGPNDGFDDAYDMTVDDSGYVYVTGESQADSGEMPGDWATVKYYPDGDTRWTKRWDDYDDRAFAVGVDDSGYVCVAGGSYRAETQSDIIIIRYDPNGDTVWLREYDGSASASDVPAYGGIAVDGSGSICVTGQCNAAVGDGDYVTMMYSTSGSCSWVSTYDGPGNGEDAAKDVAVDDSGYVYVTGFSYGGSSTGKDYATIKYDSNGDTVWLRRYNGSANGDDVATGIVVDEGYNVYVTGYSYGGKMNNDCATIRYNQDGSVGWVERYGKSGNIDERALAIALKDSNDVYVTGQSWGGASDFDYVTINYVQFLCGDANGDGVVDAGDIVYLINYLYRQGPPPDPIQAGDCNMDGEVDAGDIVCLQNYLYYQGPEPCSE